jgi:hypothetical protein
MTDPVFYGDALDTPKREFWDKQLTLNQILASIQVPPWA